MATRYIIDFGDAATPDKTEARRLLHRSVAEKVYGNERTVLGIAACGAFLIAAPFMFGQFALSGNISGCMAVVGFAGLAVGHILSALNVMQGTPSIEVTVTNNRQLEVVKSALASIPSKVLGRLIAARPKIIFRDKLPEADLGDGFRRAGDFWAPKMRNRILASLPDKEAAGVSQHELAHNLDHVLSGSENGFWSEENEAFRRAFAEDTDMDKLHDRIIPLFRRYRPEHAAKTDYEISQIMLFKHFKRGVLAKTRHFRKNPKEAFAELCAQKWGRTMCEENSGFHFSLSEVLPQCAAVLDKLSILKPDGPDNTTKELRIRPKRKQRSAKKAL